MQLDPAEEFRNAVDVIENQVQDEMMNALDQGAPIEEATSVEMMANGIAEAVLGPGPGLGSIGFPTGVQGPTGAQLSQTNTIWRNLRWYLISNIRQLLTQAYVEIGLIKTICDVPVLDAFRGGVTISTRQLSEEEIRALQVRMEEEQDLTNLAQSKIWGRLFGGGALIAATDQDPEMPLDMEALTEDSPLKFVDADLWELYTNNSVTTSTAQELDLSRPSEDTFQYYDQVVHESRILITKGSKAPSLIRARLMGWGLSEVEILIRSVNQYLKSSDLVFEVLDEFKLDVFKLKGLASTLLTANGDAQVRKRITVANLQKNYNNAIALDAEDDFDHKQLSFAGISDTMIGIRMAVASDMRMPLTKIFGISAAGFSSGEDDIENYNAMIESTIRQPAKYQVLAIVKMRCMQMFGYIPDDLMCEFKPLRVLSLEQEETVKEKKFSRVLQARQAGEITSKEFREACNKSNLLEIQLDINEAILSQLEEEQTEAEGNEEGSGADGSGSGKKSKTAPKNNPPEAKT